MRAELIDVMGSDLSVVNAARVSFDKKSEWDIDYCNVCHVECRSEDCECDGEGRLFNLKVGDQKLINYLAKHGHFTPFTHCVITLRETVPIFVARQRFKHTIGFTYNEISRRYVDDTPEFYTPDVWRSRPEGSVKQGSGGEFDIYSDEAHMLDEEYKEFLYQAGRMYEWMIDKGVAPEQARMVLPQSMMTSYYVTGSLYAFARAYNLRSDEHSQKEIQDLAAQWNQIIEPLFPHSWKALTT